MARNGPHDRFRKSLEEEYNMLEEEERRLLEEEALAAKSNNKSNQDLNNNSEEENDGAKKEDKEVSESNENSSGDDGDEKDKKEDDKEESKSSDDEDGKENKDKVDNVDSDKGSKNKDSFRNFNSRKALGSQRENVEKNSIKDLEEGKSEERLIDENDELQERINNFKDVKSEAEELAIKAKEIADKGAKTAKALATTATTTVTVLSNPLFWVGVLAFLGLVVFLAFFAIMGGNDYNKMCDNKGVGGILVGDDVDDFTRQSAIASWLMSTPFEAMGGKPFTREQAMGIMGNLLEESYGANPKTIQGDHTMTRWQTCDNDCVSKFKGGGQAIGILQWDGAAGDPRRDNLVKLAREEGKQWYDLNVQLKHLKMEIDAEGSHTYENYMLKNSGFLKEGKTIEEYTLLWAKNIERCGQCRMDDRYASAKKFNEKYAGSVGGIGGGSSSLSTQCIGSVGSGMVDASSLRTLAESIAYTRAERAAGIGKGRCPGGLNNCGMDFSKSEYVQAKNMAEEIGGADPFPNLMASCDRLVATMVRVTGMDDKFPWGDAITQVNYMINSPNWKQVSCQDRQPGDVFGQKDHIMIYVGETDDGPDTMVSASYMNRSAHMATVSCVGDKFNGDGVTVNGWRRIK